MKDQLCHAPRVQHPQFLNIQTVRGLEGCKLQLRYTVQLYCSLMDTQTVVSAEMERRRYLATLDPITVVR